MGEAIDDGDESAARQLAWLFEPFHTLTYYTPEIISGMPEQGYKGWWHAYFAYRPAPMGAVPAGVVTAAFYNFAPRMVERAVPGVWDIRAPEEVLEIRAGMVESALGRIFGDGAFDKEMKLAADLARRAIDGCDVVGRSVYAGYAELPWPEEPTMSLWHACTLLREHRGDSHNLALAAAELDGVECHVMMAARGHGNRETILGIRGWTEDEWDDAVARLVEREWVASDGSHTESGTVARSELEGHTDRLASEPVRRIGAGDAAALVGALTPLVKHLVDTGEVSGVWPPPHLIK